MSFPSSIDSYTPPTGSSLLTSPDHAGQHASFGSAITAIENKLGLNSGSASNNSILTGVGAGSSSWSTVGTLNGFTFGTPAITGGTIANAVINTPTINGGTVTSFVGTASSNNLIANGLNSLTTQVNVSAGSAPTIGQVLTATSGTTATWQSSSGINASIQKSSGSQNITTNVTTNIIFDTKNYDTNSMVNLGANADRLTVQTAGLYLITTVIAIAPNNTATRQIGINAGGTTFALNYENALSSGGQVLNASFSVNLGSAAVIQTWLFQDSGGTLAVIGGYLQAAKIG